MAQEFEDPRRLTTGRSPEQLADLQRRAPTDPAASSRYFDLVKDFIPPGVSYLEVLRNGVRHGANGDIRIVSALALGKLNEIGGPAVDDLFTMAMNSKFTHLERSAAFHGLTGIADKHAVEKLQEFTTRLLRDFKTDPSHERQSYIESIAAAFVAGANNGTDWLSELKRIYNGVYRINPKLGEFVKHEIGDRGRRERDLRQAELSNYQDVLSYHELGPGGTGIERGSLGELRNEPGLVHNDRFLFRPQHGPGCECGLKIYQASDRTVIVFTTDQASYGRSVQNEIETLATAVMRGFNLDPAKVSVIENWPVESGSSFPKASHMKFEYDETYDYFKNPSWQERPNLAAALRDFGIER